MRICDICFRELKEEGGYEIKDGQRIDNCGECLDKIIEEYAGKDDSKLVEEYIRMMEEKDKNIEEIVYRMKRKSNFTVNDILCETEENQITPNI